MDEYNQISSFVKKWGRKTVGAESLRFVVTKSIDESSTQVIDNNSSKHNVDTEIGSGRNQEVDGKSTKGYEMCPKKDGGSTNTFPACLTPGTLFDHLSWTVERQCIDLRNCVTASDIYNSIYDKFESDV